MTQRIFQNPTSDLSMEQLDQVISAVANEDSVIDWILDKAKQEAGVTIVPPKLFGKRVTFVPEQDLEETTSAILNQEHFPEFLYEVFQGIVKTKRTFPIAHKHAVEVIKSKQSRSLLRRVLEVLLDDRERIVQTFDEFYNKLGEFQSNFLSTLDLKDLKVLPISQVSEILNLPYHSTAYFRFVSNKYVAIDSFAGSVPYFPVRLLTPSEDIVKSYKIIDILNQYFALEFNTTAFKDHDISNAEKILARRTVAKYRGLANIPNHSDRKRAYNSGERKTPYRIHNLAEIYLTIGKYSPALKYEEEKDTVSIEGIVISKEKLDHNRFRTCAEFQKSRDQALIGAYNSMNHSIRCASELLAESGLITSFAGKPLSKSSIEALLYNRNNGGK